jgi:hypothetical protein
LSLTPVIMEHRRAAALSRLSLSAGNTFPNLDTSAPRDEQARTAIPAQTWRTLKV